MHCHPSRIQRWSRPVALWTFVWLLLLASGATSPQKQHHSTIGTPSTTTATLSMVSAEHTKPSANLPISKHRHPSKRLSDTQRLLNSIRGGAGPTSLAPEQLLPKPEGGAFSSVLRKALKKGLGGGIPGAIAGVIQVLTLMWLRTLINYQSRYGTNFRQCLKILYQEGGIARFYQGWEWAILQAPLARFLSTFANEGVTVLWNQYFPQSIGSSTAVAALLVGVLRILIMPLDTIKTVLQVDSHDGFAKLKARLAKGHFGVLYHGAAATAASSIIGHYPWFVTFTFLSESRNLHAWLPESELIRNALFGFCASVVSDVSVNAIRVIKTTKQTMATRHSLSYAETIQMIIQADGLPGLLGRGLKARILANGVQSVVFAVIWKGLSQRLADRQIEQQVQVKEMQGPEAVSRGYFARHDPVNSK